jgi:hypothetical protein
VSRIRCGVGLGWLAVGLLSAAHSGCHRTPAAPHLASVRVGESSLQALAEAGLDQAEVQAAASAALAEAGFLLTPGPPAWRAHLEVLAVRLVPLPEGPGLRIETRLEVELVSEEGAEPARREQGGGAERVGPAGSGPALRSALLRAVGEAARGLRIGLASDQKPVEALLKDLESSDVRQRDHAIQALGERRERRAVPGLMRRLRDGDPGVVDRAIGALSQIRDPLAVPALIELSREGDAAGTLRLVPAVGDIGGPDALGWLLTLQQAHPDQRVRQAAGVALDALGQRQAAAAPRK